MFLIIVIRRIDVGPKAYAHCHRLPERSGECEGPPLPGDDHRPEGDKTAPRLTTPTTPTSAARDEQKVVRRGAARPPPPWSATRVPGRTVSRSRSCPALRGQRDGEAGQRFPAADRSREPGSERATAARTSRCRSLSLGPGFPSQGSSRWSSSYRPSPTRFRSTSLVRRNDGTPEHRPHLPEDRVWDRAVRRPLGPSVAARTDPGHLSLPQPRRLSPL